MKRVLIIGLDGGAPELVAKWQNDLPHLQQLMRNGTAGTLQSSVPPRSVPAWYCFLTGMNPAKLNVFGFSQRRAGTYDYTFANFSFCQAPPFWRWFEGAGIESAILHVPGTFPPRTLEGFMVSGWPGPLNKGQLTYTYPSALSREIDRLLEQPFEFVSPKAIEVDNDAEMLGERLRILDMHGDVAAALLGEREWQVGLVVFSPLDRASHQFWRHMDPQHQRHDREKAQLFGDALKKVYVESDRQIGRLLELVDEEDWVFVVSDHGFGPSYRTFYFNEWLKENGYLVLGDENELGRVSLRSRLIGRLAAPLFRLNEASPLFRRLAGPMKKRALSNFIRDEYVRVKEEGLVRLNHLPVDWSRTRAYCSDESTLYLNLRGRDPQGIVSPGAEAEHLLQEIAERLRELRDPETDQKIPVQVWRKEEIYRGPYLAEAPEMIVAMDHFRTNVMAELGSNGLFDMNPLWSGNHTPDGLFVAQGPGVVAGAEIEAQIVDVAPTILHLLGLPVPGEMDGEILLSLFDRDAEVRQREVNYMESSLQSVSTSDFSAEEEAQVEKQLRDLGYLS